MSGTIDIDATSLIADVAASVTLAEVEAELSSRGLTLDVDDVASRGAVGAWLEQGAPGARDPWRDPADHLLAGLVATLRDGRTLEVRPGPRRAVGPDLIALFVSCRGRFGSITRAWLRVHHRDVARPDAAPFVHPRDPEVTADEARLLDAIERELAHPSR